jgi:peptidoglycan/xylan/chitin deacetylase (PgdA/CDA1 family)
MRKSHILAATLIKLSAIRLADALWGPDRLTVLVYHRIGDADAPDFEGYRPNVSATPEQFRRQMAYVAEHFNVIDLARLQSFVVNDCPLPPRPLLITFDDGYLDNYTNAFPILRSLGLPAVIFLITNHMDDPTLPWWDQCAYYFRCTARTSAPLPFIGDCALATCEQRGTACDRLIETLKHVPEIYKQRAVQELRIVLGVDLPPDQSIFLSWEQARELVANQIACQPHTVSHPILSQVDYAEMSRQLRESHARIEAETGQAATAFAYPNGLQGDYTEAALRAVHEVGYSLAFTHQPGPIHADLARQHPLEISRIPMNYRDTFEMFVTKVMGTFSFWRRPAFVPEQRYFHHRIESAEQVVLR